MSKDEICTCKACENTVFIVKYANLWGFCCRRRRGCLSSLLSCAGNKMLLSRASDTSSRVMVKIINPALTWHQFLWPCTGSSFPTLGTHPLFPILNFYLLLKEYLSHLTNVSNFIVLVNLLPQKLNAFCLFIRLKVALSKFMILSQKNNLHCRPQT